EPFVVQFFRSVFYQVFSLSGKSDNQLPVTARTGDFTKNVRRSREFELERVLRFLDFLICRASGRVISNSRCADKDGGVPRIFDYRIAHFQCGSSFDQTHLRRRIHGGDSSHQSYVGAPSEGGLRQRKPLASRERVGRNLTGSIGSRVAPAVIKICSPARSPSPAPLSRIPSAAATMRSGSLNRPGPIVPQAISPASGSIR